MSHRDEDDVMGESRESQRDRDKDKVRDKSRRMRRDMDSEMDREMERRYEGSAGEFQRLESGGGDQTGAARSIEGWIVIVTGVHDEAQEEDIQQPFGEFGAVKNLHLNLDRRTGFAKGYAYIEYEMQQEARDAIEKMNGGTILGQPIKVDWAFLRMPTEARSRRRKD